MKLREYINHLEVTAIDLKELMAKVGNAEVIDQYEGEPIINIDYVEETGRVLVF